MLTIVPESIPGFYPDGFDFSRLTSSALRIVTNYAVRLTCANYLGEKFPGIKGRELLQVGIRHILGSHIDDDSRLISKPDTAEFLRPGIRANRTIVAHVYSGESGKAYSREVSRNRGLAFASLLLGYQDALLARKYGVGEVEEFFPVRIVYPQID
jgi:hypothetical protein